MQERYITVLLMIILPQIFFFIECILGKAAVSDAAEELTYWKTY